jgi:EmrB/QacA subfamily drug resistance transporter
LSQAAPQNESSHGTWIVLIMTAIAMTMVAYNTTAAITILPDLKSEFDMRPTTLQWVMSIYTVSAAALLPVLARLGDLIGKMKIYVFGVAIFGLGALAITLATDASLVLIGRLGQGIGAGALLGSALAVLSAATPEARRGFVLGLWGAMIALGIGLGPVIGGVFAEYLSWRGVFASDLVLVTLGLVIAIRVIRAGYVPETPRSDAGLDYAGAIALILFLGPLTFALAYGQDHGWTHPITLGNLLVAALAVIAFVAIERRPKEPLLHLRYLRLPRFLMAAFGMLVVGIFLTGALISFSLFVQSPDTLALSPVMAGAAVLPLTLTMFVLAVTAPRILGPYNARLPITIGMIAFALGALLLAGIGNDSSYAEIWWRLVVVGIGFGLTMPLLPHVGLRLLPDEHAGQGSGVINGLLYFGATLGVVLGGVVSALTIRTHIATVLDALPVDSAKHEALSTTLAHGSAGEVQQALDALEPSAGATLRAALSAVLDDAFDHTMLALAVIAVLGAVLATWLMRGPVPAPHSAALARRGS